ncbi:YALI0A07755p [Yarrowia lipolytica CLIB122]|uniref:YALI0A07755p n=2 Tax=Yarrowia lipolytica TaxID=4952 RepID=Q6CHL0_YARLI|nr:YALI0A07755p [Yarrowia lipolytica CLIB122]AOW00367.1 hypothetical protein YALI1_A07309g [Yarrowia lipolytica]KAB8281766.1 hypothetical protein BKA91DRAFT_115032 [Yarrowia lipolytica]KAE8170403.1 hypothetical protein BKA90DRAFT_158547 [Yarrowia lipolytica]KAJ8051454.1 hypothetical protein LXG23DRAFT_27015 [Yarrowia lipolytica]RMI97129.1 hypothetical protein BD777DRAFT_147798 [Yarrowia lipolytica]|eukprot:XP_499851.1 YALI0A07755p [Yarrowia lipolytica CLIB122]
MTQAKYNRKNIFYFRVLEHKKKTVAVCFPADGEPLPVSYVSNGTAAITDWLKANFSDTSNTTVVIVDPVTDRKYSLSTNQKLLNAISRHVEIVVPYVFQWVAYDRPTGENYKNLNFPFQMTEKYLNAGYPLPNAIEQGFRGANLKKAWKYVNLDNFDAELDCIKTDIKFERFYNSFYTKHASSGEWSAKFMTDPKHLRMKKYKIGRQEGLDNGTIQPVFCTKGDGGYEVRTGWVAADDVKVKLEKARSGFD